MDRRQRVIAFYVVSRRHRMRATMARAERLAKRLRMGKALLCTCTLTNAGLAYYKTLDADARHGRLRFRTA